MKLITRSRPTTDPITADRIESAPRRGARVAQILAGDRGRLADRIKGRASRIAGRAGSRHDIHAVRHLPVHEELLAAGDRTLFDDLQLEQPGRPDDLLRAIDVGDAGK